MDKNNLKILIIGTGSLLNYGCEAIVQGSYYILKKYIPNCEIYLASDDFEYDRKILPRDIILVKYKKRFTLYRVIKGVLRRFLHIGQGSYVHLDCNIGKKFDIVLSSGGDNYCEAPNQTIYLFLRELMEIGHRTAQKGNQYTLWGASVGPFKNKNNELSVIENLQEATRIFVREELSYKYLSQFKQLNNKLVLVADPAFAMQALDYDLDKDPNAIYVGINLSLLAFSYTDGNMSDYIRCLISQLNFLLLNNPKIRLVFIPHVQQTGMQDDMELLLPLYEGITDKKKVVLIDKGLGARKTKGLIRQLDLLIASRMHCCVGGISVGTPTLFVTYSNKGKGMSFYAYGHHNYEIECSVIGEDEFITKVNLMLDSKERIKNYLLLQNDRFMRDACKAGKLLVQENDTSSDCVR